MSCPTFEFKQHPTFNKRWRLTPKDGGFYVVLWIWGQSDITIEGQGEGGAAANLGEN
jgi:hypothetical protein